MHTESESTRDEPPVNRLRRRVLGKRVIVGASLVSIGAAGGGYLAAASGASAATPAVVTAATPAASPCTSGADGQRGLSLTNSGTVTAVGSASVTIGTTVYAVGSNSDIDKNGESTLSALSLGDKVTFSTVTNDGVVTIDKLHAGSEALDHPAGGPGGPGGPGRPEGAPERAPVQ